MVNLPWRQKHWDEVDVTKMKFRRPYQRQKALIALDRKENTSRDLSAKDKFIKMAYRKGQNSDHTHPSLWLFVVCYV